MQDAKPVGVGLPSPMRNVTSLKHMAQPLENRRKRRFVVEMAESLLFLIFLAGAVYISPSLRHIFYTSDGWRLQRDGYLGWAKGVIHNPATSVAVFAATSAVLYFGMRLIRLIRR